MKQIIGGVRYDTDTAQYVADVSPRGYARGDFAHEDTNLYRAGDDWFLAGRGGPSSRWAQPFGAGGWTDGEGIRPIAADEARELLERFCWTDELEEHFGHDIVDAGQPRPAADGPGR